MTILIIGNPGSGKTWIMKQLIEKYALEHNYALGLVKYKSNGRINVLGKYDGSMYEGSDRLSMGVMADVSDYLEYNQGKTTIAEGDRFSNKRFIEAAQATVIKILDDGAQGRERRGSSQTERHLKSMATRVRNLPAKYEVKDSAECLELINRLIYENY